MIAIFTSALGRALSKQEKAFVDLLLKNGRINAHALVRFNIYFFIQNSIHTLHN
jgi:hypothetical protein